MWNIWNQFEHFQSILGIFAILVFFWVNLVFSAFKTFISIFSNVYYVGQFELFRVMFENFRAIFIFFYIFRHFWIISVWAIFGFILSIWVKFRVNFLCQFEYNCQNIHFGTHYFIFSRLLDVWGHFWYFGRIFSQGSRHFWKKSLKIGILGGQFSEFLCQFFSRFSYVLEKHFIKICILMVNWHFWGHFNDYWVIFLLFYILYIFEKKFLIRIFTSTRTFLDNVDVFWTFWWSFLF